MISSSYTYRLNQVSDYSSNCFHYFVNFPHILLKEIVSSLDNLDIICFGFVCKKWYNERNNFIEFNSNKILLQNNVNFKNHLTSYSNLINTAIKLKTNNILLIPYCSEVYDYLCDDPSEVSNILNHSRIRTVIYGGNSNTFFNFDILNAISLSPATTSLTIGQHAYLKTGDISPKIKELILMHNNSTSVELKLPAKLEKLEMGFRWDRNYNMSTLPDTLRYLSIYYSETPLPSLPPQLEELHFFINYFFPLPNELLPKTLHTMSGVLLCPNLKLNMSIKTYSISSTIDNDFQLPPNLIDLSIHIKCFDESCPVEFIPTSVEKLSIFVLDAPKSSLNFKISDLFMEHQTSQLNLKHLNLKATVMEIKEGFFPNGLESLDLDLKISNYLSKGILPTGIKELALPTLPTHIKRDHFIPDHFIPDSVETLTLRNHCDIPQDIIPHSVTKLVISPNFFSGNIDLHSLPNTVESIDIESYPLYIQFPDIKMRRFDCKHHIILNTVEEFDNFRMSGIVETRTINNYLRSLYRKIPKSKMK